MEIASRRGAYAWMRSRGLLVFLANFAARVLKCGGLKTLHGEPENTAGSGAVAILAHSILLWFPVLWIGVSLVLYTTYTSYQCVSERGICSFSNRISLLQG